MNRLIIVGSPRTRGRSAALANLLFESCIEECPEDELALVPLSEVDVAGCADCGACGRLAAGLSLDDALADAEGLRGDGVGVAADELLTDGLASGEPVVGGFNGGQAASARPAEDTTDEQPEKAPAPKSKQAAQFDHPRRCSIDDDMSDIYPLIDEAEELTIVSPVYFAGPPSQLKALLDRLQPYYAANAEERAAAAAEGVPFKTAVRPAVLHVVGEGTDPHGYAALVDIVRSAVAVAGFKLEAVLDWVGKISPDGEIVEEAEFIDLLSEDEDVLAEVEVMFDDEGSREEAAAEAAGESGRAPSFDRGDPDHIDAELARPRLRLDDVQVQERGRASAEAGRSGGRRGRTEKRSGKGGSQTNNRNPRKENQSKAKKRHASNGASSGAKSAGSHGQNGSQNSRGSLKNSQYGAKGRGRAHGKPSSSKGRSRD